MFRFVMVKCIDFDHWLTPCLRRTMIPFLNIYFLFSYLRKLKGKYTYLSNDVMILSIEKLALKDELWQIFIISNISDIQFHLSRQIQIIQSTINIYKKRLSLTSIVKVSRFQMVFHIIKVQETKSTLNIVEKLKCYF